MITVEQIVNNQDYKTIALGPDALVAEIAEVMTSKHLSLVVICSEGGQVIGVVSWRDLVKAIAEISGDTSNIKASELLTKNPTACNIDDDIHDVLKTMIKRHFEHMPVVQYGRLVGMVNMIDILKALNAENDMEKLASLFSNLEYI